ncbi:MAG: metallophosphoesterase family protein [Ignavibacteria bacterium]
MYTSGNNIIAVIGDIHGCYHTLVNLYNQLIAFTSEIYSVGDLIDRGKYSKEVVEFCIQHNIKPVRGNHEEMLINAVDSVKDTEPILTEQIALYYYNGGEETQESYSQTRSYLLFHKFIEELEKSGHLQFFRQLPLKYEFDTAIITHAGIVKGADENDWLWNRQIPSSIGKLQVAGHTPYKKVQRRKLHYLLIDTGCVYGQSLSSGIINVATGEVIKIISIETNLKDLF